MGTELYMLLYTAQNFDTLENVLNYTFIYIQNEKTLMCKNLFDVQISYSDIRKMKYENREPIKCDIWYFHVCYFPAGIYLLKANNKNTRIRC